MVICTNNKMVIKIHRQFQNKNNKINLRENKDDNLNQLAFIQVIHITIHTIMTVQDVIIVIVVMDIAVRVIFVTVIITVVLFAAILFLVVMDVQGFIADVLTVLDHVKIVIVLKIIIAKDVIAYHAVQDVIFAQTLVMELV